MRTYRSLVWAWVVLASVAGAAVIEVPGEVATIQGAIQQAADWDIIVVSVGTYNENLDFLGKKIVLRSVDPNDWNTVNSTIVNGRCMGSCITINKGEGPDSIVEGLTIQLGSGTTLTHQGSTYRIVGGGLLCVDSSPTIRRCQICWNGYQMYTPGVFPPSRFRAIYQSGGGIALIGDCRARIEDCLLVNNAAESWGSAIYAKTAQGREHLARSIVERCTISDNISGGPYTILKNFAVDGSNTQLQIRNTILGHDTVQVSNSDQIQYSCAITVFLFSGSATGSRVDVAGKNGNIADDPQFVLPYRSTTPTMYDYRLTGVSPCINHGDPGFDGQGFLDLAGQKRIQIGRLDMGVFEFVPETRMIHPMEGDIWAAGSRHVLAWEQPELNQVVISNAGFELSEVDPYTSDTTYDEQVPGWTVGPSSGVMKKPIEFDDMPTGQSQYTGYSVNNGRIDQLLEDCFQPNCRYTLKLFVGRRWHSSFAPNWQAALTAGDLATIAGAVTQEQCGIPEAKKWIAVSLILETGAEGVDSNVGKRIGITLTGEPRAEFDEVSLEVAELAPATVDVEYSADGENWETIADDLLDTGLYRWRIRSDLAEENVRIRAVSNRPDFVSIPSGRIAILPYQAGPAIESRWPTKGHDMQRTGSATDNGPELGCVIWQYPHESSILSGPVIGPEERIYIAGDDGVLVALDSAGEAIWSYEMASPATSGITIGPDGTAHIGDESGILYAVDLDGQLRWIHQTTGMIAGAPAITSDGKIIFTSADGMIVALEADGSELWSFLIPGWGEIGGAAVAPPAIGRDGYIYIGDMNTAILYALDPADGRILWACDFAAVGKYGSIINSPVVGADGTIYMTLLRDTNLYAVNPSNGAIAWKTNLAGSGGGYYSSDYPQRFKAPYPWYPPAIGPDGTIFVAFDDPYLRAVNPDGTIRWIRRLGMIGGFSVSVGGDGKIYAAGDDLVLYVLDAEGTILSRMDGMEWTSAPALGADETLYVGDYAGTLWAVAPQPCEDQSRQLSRPADITLDGTIRMEDLAGLTIEWKECTDAFAGSPCMTTGSGWKRISDTVYLLGDIDRDGYVGMSDLLVMAENWMK